MGTLEFYMVVCEQFPADFDIPSLFEFHSGHLTYDINQDIKGANIGLVAKILSGRTDTDADLASIQAKILRAETKLNFSVDQLRPFPLRTRHTLKHLFSALPKRTGKVGLPVPNWDFWSYMGTDKDNFTFEYFNALSADELVDRFAKLASKSAIDAVLLTSPSNPLGIRITPEHAKSIDKTALKYGIEIIVDDIPRGTMALNDRDTIASFMTRPYLVEGYSHRFGEGPFAPMSYILVPQGSDVLPRAEIPKSSAFKLLDLVYDYSTVPIVDEMERRNSALDSGLAMFLPEVKIQRSSKSSIVSVFSLPGKIKAKSFANYAGLQGVLAPEVDYFYPKGFKPTIETGHMVRFAVGALDAASVYQGACKYSELVAGKLR